jgi:predicted nucleic acid-binding protein
VATADNVYVDPSALLKLYLNEPESRAMAGWRARHAGPLVVTLHGRVEMANALALAAYRHYLSDAALAAGLAASDDDFDAGRYRLADLLWRATLKRAEEMSRRHTGLGRWNVRSWLPNGKSARRSHRRRRPKTCECWGTL